jgi:hypothetical protein
VLLARIYMGDRSLSSGAQCISDSLLSRKEPAASLLMPPMHGGQWSLLRRKGKTATPSTHCVKVRFNSCIPSFFQLCYEQAFRTWCLKLALHQLSDVTDPVLHVCLGAPCMRIGQALSLHACRTALDVGRRSELDQAYQEGGAFLRSIGFEANAEISRILDVAMNPNSLFVTLRDKKRAGNAAVSPSVQHLG